MRISDWSSDVCSSDLVDRIEPLILKRIGTQLVQKPDTAPFLTEIEQDAAARCRHRVERCMKLRPAIAFERAEDVAGEAFRMQAHKRRCVMGRRRSEEHTSELQSPTRNSYDVLCLKKKNN